MRPDEGSQAIEDWKKIARMDWHSLEPYMQGYRKRCGRSKKAYPNDDSRRTA